MEIYFHGYKIRYEKLDEYLLPIRASHNIRTMNIFINVDDLFHKMHRPYTDNEFQCIGSGAGKEFISNLLNLVGHYKNWAYKAGIYPKVFLIYTSSKKFRNEIYIDTFRGHYKDINDPENMAYFNVNSTIAEALTLIRTMTKYIPGAYAIDSEYLEPSIVPYLLSTTETADYNILISRDEYDLQYAYMDKWIYLSPKGENSSFITAGTLWEYIKRREKIDEEFSFDPTLFLWAKAIVGDKYRSVPKLTRTGWKTIIKYIRHSELSPDAKLQSEYQYARLTKYLADKSVAGTSLQSNISCISVIRQADNTTSIDKSMILSQIVDMEDSTALASLNNSVFKLFPLNLPFLLRGNIARDTSKDKYFWQR